jgi:undecaprenyl-diphosphatase
VLSTLLELDRQLTTWMAAQCSAVPVQWVLVVFTWLGVGGSIWLALIGAGWMATPRRRAALWRAVMALAFTFAMVDWIAKPLVARERPFLHGPAPSAIVWRPTSSSFPSGHAASAAAGALALSRAWPPAAVPLTLLAAAITFSRVGLGVHYVGDVTGGVLIGLLMASLACPRRLHVSRDPDPPRISRARTGE